MAADLHIHVLEGIDEETLRTAQVQGAGWNEANDRIAKTPSVWIGEVSWAKALLSGDSDAFVPGPVARVRELIGTELPLLDADLEAQLLDALKCANTTDYRIAEARQVAMFLAAHRGKRLFCVSW